MFNVGDVVRIKKPMFDYEKGSFMVKRVNAMQIGCPVYLTDSSGNPVGSIYGYRADSLELVSKTREKPEAKRLRELEERVEKLERHLGWRL